MYHSEYRNKLTEAEEAVSGIADGSTIVTTGNVAAPGFDIGYDECYCSRVKGHSEYCDSEEK